MSERGDHVSFRRWYPIGEAEHERALYAAGSNGLIVLAGLGLLRLRAPKKNRDLFYASLENIARACGMSKRRVIEPLRKLEEAKLIFVLRPVGAERLRHDANRYRILTLAGGDKTSPAAVTETLTEMAPIIDVSNPYGGRETSSAAEAAPALAGPHAADGDRWI